MIEHTARAFDTDLQDLARKVAEMGRLVEEQIAAALVALAKQDTALAKRVIAADDGIDDLQQEIEDKAVATIARRQPMANVFSRLPSALRIMLNLTQKLGAAPGDP
jgi:phosphate transport system protein